MSNQSCREEVNMLATKNSKLFLIMGVFLVFSLFGLCVGGSAAVAAQKSQFTAVLIKGWLLDKCCSGTKDPAQHTKHCSLMATCAASGYGVVEKQSDGSYQFYLFDERGQRLVKDFLSKTTKETNLSVTVKGVWDGAILKVERITE